MVEDASNSHLLDKLLLANTCQGCVVCPRPLAALHQDGQRRTVQQGCNGDQAEQVDPINVLQGYQYIRTLVLDPASLRLFAMQMSCKLRVPCLEHGHADNVVKRLKEFGEM